MPTRHRLLAILVAVLWGANFIAIHATLEHFPPFFSVALRWIPLALVAILFVPRPDVPWRWIVGYGLGFGTLQFVFLYWGMATGMPVGLASLVLQSSAPFTVVLGALLGEHLSGRRGLGVLVAMLGLAIVGSQRGDVSAAWPFVLTVLGGLGWAFGNLAARRAQTTQPLRLTMWMSVVPPVPMLALSLLVEGPSRIADSWATVGTGTGVLALAGLAYTALIATVIGSGIWSWLMARHPAGTVAPFSMLVPVTGLTAAWLALGERPTLVEWLGCAVVVVGVLLTASGRHTPSSAGRVAMATTSADVTDQERVNASATSSSRSLASRSAMVARAPSVP
ncbi:membrane protein [Knoellia sinensis KCTC 19936]|uniref:Membrane protein n=1 Tax=Knoellia sinensis KCTC 19936 TaxID=1385520 RepID=A0A0A0J4L0_9MICO|nr:EamA family transporter [Knoellia sinensis]KGN31684.1 membrane protein [Knoellia sinensis KCTC 19936]